MSDPRTGSAAADLPEVNWLWRRLYSFGVTAALLGLLAYSITRMTDPAALRKTALLLVGSLVLQQLLYVGGATLYELWQLVSAVRTTRFERVTVGPPPTRHDDDGASR